VKTYSYMFFLAACDGANANVSIVFRIQIDGLKTTFVGQLYRDIV
jgi:hypothetical protein